MPLCTVCTHLQHLEVDAALVEYRSGVRDVAGRFGLSKKPCTVSSRNTY